MANPSENINEKELTAHDLALLTLVKFCNSKLNLLKAQDEFNAYHKLIESDFNLDVNDEAWKFIDESPEYFEVARNKKSIQKLADQYNCLGLSKLGDGQTQRTSQNV